MSQKAWIVPLYRSAGVSYFFLGVKGEAGAYGKKPWDVSLASLPQTSIEDSLPGLSNTIQSHVSLGTQLIYEADSTVDSSPRVTYNIDHQVTATSRDHRRRDWREE